MAVLSHWWTHCSPGHCSTSTRYTIIRFTTCRLFRTCVTRLSSSARRSGVVLVQLVKTSAPEATTRAVPENCALRQHLRAVSREGPESRHCRSRILHRHASHSAICLRHFHEKVEPSGRVCRTQSAAVQRNLLVASQSRVDMQRPASAWQFWNSPNTLAQRFVWKKRESHRDGRGRRRHDQLPAADRAVA
jgi:hypothetical protein